MHLKRGAHRFFVALEMLGVLWNAPDYSTRYDKSYALRQSTFYL